MIELEKTATILESDSTVLTYSSVVGVELAKVLNLQFPAFGAIYVDMIHGQQDRERILRLRLMGF